MKKDEFDKLFVSVKKAISPKSEEEISAKLMSYIEDPENVKIHELMAYLQMESKKYTNDLVYQLLLATVVEPD